MSLALIALALLSPPAVAAAPDDAVVVTWDGGQLTYGELHAKARGQLTQMESEYLMNRYQAEQEAAEQFAVEGLLQSEADARGLEDINALIEAEITSKTEVPTEEQVKSFYDMVAPRMGNPPLEDLHDDIVTELQHQAEAQLFAAYVETLKAEKHVKIDVPYPDLPRVPVGVDQDPSRGPDDAKVTIVEFAEFQCPYCGKVNPTIDALMKANEGKVRLVFRDFPLSGHPEALPAALAANCAAKQGKYWEMHDLLMQNQSTLGEDAYAAHAEAVGLNMRKWKKCLDDPAMVEEVKQDQQDGIDAGVNGTPAFFVNGLMLSGALPLEEFQAVIDRELAR